MKQIRCYKKDFEQRIVFKDFDFLLLLKCLLLKILIFTFFLQWALPSCVISYEICLSFFVTNAHVLINHQAQIF